MDSSYYQHGECFVAIKRSHSSSINSFRQYHRAKVASFIIVSQIATTIGIGGVLLLTGITDYLSPYFWLTIVLLFCFGISTLIVLLPIVTAPIDDVLAALAHKIGEPTKLVPPNPNAKDNRKTGLKDILQAIYADSPAKDIPATKKDEDDSASRTAILTEALNHTSCGVILLDSDKHILSANKAAPIGRNQDGTPFIALDFIDDIDITTWLDEQGDSISAEYRWQRVPTNPSVIKHQRFFDVIASYNKGATAETVVILVDQSARYNPEEEDLNFIAFAAHELRGPITIIRGYLDILDSELADRFEGDESELLERLIVSANRLSGYINNILNVARFDRHHLNITLLEDTVSGIYASIADDMQMRAKTQHRLLTVTIPDDLPTVAADRSSISEVISNLIDNAIKYSFEGGVITVSAQVKGDFDEISITDNGIGMPASVVKNLFRKFYRSHRSREAVAGTGIGLYICKAFVESHGGNISVVSQENEGSTFTFTLPIYATVADKLLESDQLNQGLIRQGGGWIKNHAMYRR